MRPDKYTHIRFLIIGLDNSAGGLSTNNKLKCDCMIASGKGQARVRPILYMHTYVHF